MTPPRVFRSLGQFFLHLLYRDRYLTEVLTAFVTLGLAFTAATRISLLDASPFLIGFRDMPDPELWVALFTLPGLRAAWTMRRRGDRDWRETATVMGLFLALCAASYVTDFANWFFWTAVAFVLGFASLYALVQDNLDLRWALAFLNTLFHGALFLLIIVHAPFVPLTHAHVGGFAAASLLSISRLSGRRAAWKS